jgi:hypothetical protein
MIDFSMFSPRLRVGLLFAYASGYYLLTRRVTVRLPVQIVPGLFNSLAKLHDQRF